ncbi:hypothetical protein CHISP_3586 [Chitinispirillum alkaliphilum]|nr:hypothetical protein CHISP_3586 [Chitinispirillum alkaliphilum]
MYDTEEMFPICMGMNRRKARLKAELSHVPHMHGDEPYDENLRKWETICSPYAWG